jgi:hypothetical protein
MQLSRQLIVRMNLHRETLLHIQQFDQDSPWSLIRFAKPCFPNRTRGRGMWRTSAKAIAAPDAPDKAWGEQGRR